MTNRQKTITKAIHTLFDSKAEITDFYFAAQILGHVFAAFEPKEAEDLHTWLTAQIERIKNE